MLEVSEGGRAVLMGVAVGVALPLDLSRSFSALSVSISFCWSTRDLKKKKKRRSLRERASRPRQQGAIPLPGLDSVVILNQYYWN